MTDVELLAMHRQGDESAFADLVRRHLGWVCGLARRRLRDAHRAEDVAQAVFVLLHRKAPVFATDGAMIGWLHKAAWYAAETAARDERRRVKRETEAAEMQAQARDESDVQWRQLAPLLDDLVGRLSRSDREAILLRYYRDLSFAEVAEQLGTTPDAARKRVERAIEKLRNLAAGKGLTLSIAALPALLAANVRLVPPPGLVATATVTATAHAGSALALSTGSVVKGAIIMMTTKQLAVAGIAAAIFLCIAGGTIATTAYFLSDHSKPQVITMPAPAPINANPSGGVIRLNNNGIRLNVTAAGNRGMPFSAVRWRAADKTAAPEIPEVFVNSIWYELTAINDKPIADIISFAKGWAAKDDWQRRFIEDLSDILAAMNLPAGPVKLQLLTLSDQQPVTLTNVPMEAGNRSMNMFGKAADMASGTLSLFSGVRWNDTKAEVQINGNDTWYELLAIGKHDAADVFAFARTNYGDQWQSKIERDSMAVMKAMGDPEASTVMLKLRPLDSNEDVSIVKCIFPPLKIATLAVNQANVVQRLAVLNSPNAPMSGTNKFTKAAPYSAIRWQDSTPQVFVNGTWYDLTAINDVPVDQIISYQKASGDVGNFQKHFDEDLVEIMSRMGHAPGGSVKLQLQTLDKQEPVTLENIPMTPENRAAILSAGVQTAPK